ncbi:MAG TPA: hypothetical protein VIV09_12445 [Pseudolabrys sp.]
MAKRIIKVWVLPDAAPLHKYFLNANPNLLTVMRGKQPSPNWIRATLTLSPPKKRPKEEVTP